MKKKDALAKFSCDPKQQIAEAAKALGITQQAIYQWDEVIPALRAAQIELMEVRGQLAQKECRTK